MTSEEMATLIIARKARKEAVEAAFRWVEVNGIGTLDGFMLVVGRFQHFYLTGEIMTP